MNGPTEARTPEELARVIDSSPEHWVAGREQLYNGQLLAWLGATGNSNIVAGWKKIENRFRDREDAGLEAFLHLLADDLAEPEISVEPSQVRVPDICPGRQMEWTLVVRNPGRGQLYAVADIEPAVAGLSIEPRGVDVNGPLRTMQRLTLRFDARQSLAAATSIKLTLPDGSAHHVPVTLECIPLERALIDPNPMVRQAAAEAAGVLRARSTVGLLCRLASDQAPAARHAAVIALGQLGEPSAAPALRRASRERDTSISEPALAALQQVDPKSARRVANVRRLDDFVGRYYIMIFILLMCFTLPWGILPAFYLVARYNNWKSEKALLKVNIVYLGLIIFVLLTILVVWIGTKIF